MSHLLPRFAALAEAQAFQVKLSAILLVTGAEMPARIVSSATLPGDSRRLRGIPVIARGVRGASPGSAPGDGL